MSSFIVLLFDSEQAKEKLRGASKKFGVSVYDVGYGVDPSIEKPHLFLEGPATSMIGFANHYHKEGIKKKQE